MKVTLEITSDEFNLLCDKIKHMRCIVRDANDAINYRDYCNGRCGDECDHPELCNPVEWLQTKIVSTKGTPNKTEIKFGILASVSPDDLNDGSFTFPSNVKTIGDSAFSNIYKLRYVAIPEDIKTINGWAFAHCKNLEHVIIPEGVEIIHIGTFKDCKSLRRIILPESVHTIEGIAFAGCENLQEIIIPGDIKHITWNAFMHCPKLEWVRLKNPIKDSDEIFGNHVNISYAL